MNNPNTQQHIAAKGKPTPKPAWLNRPTIVAVSALPVLALALYTLSGWNAVEWLNAHPITFDNLGPVLKNIGRFAALATALGYTGLAMWQWLVDHNLHRVWLAWTPLMLEIGFFAPWVATMGDPTTRLWLIGTPVDTLHVGIALMPVAPIVHALWLIARPSLVGVKAPATDPTLPSLDKP